MGPNTILEPRRARGRGQDQAMAVHRRRFLLTAAALSVAVHLAAPLLGGFLPRLLPREAPAREPGTIELLMVEQKGATPNQAGTGQEQPPTPPPATAVP